MTETTEPGGGDPAPDAPAMPIVAQRALAAPVTVNRAARTVEVVWSTGARARNFVAPLGPIIEELDMRPEAVRMDALRSGRAPVLDTHRRAGTRDVLGRVTAARIEAGRGYATLQFSGADDVEPIWQRVADGTLQSVSVGYRVHRYEPRPDAATGQTIHRAVDWEPYEISIVPVPVDGLAVIRGEEPQGAPATAIEPALTEDPTMPETTPASPDPAPAPPAPPIALPQETTVTTPPASAPPTAPPEPTRAMPPTLDVEAIRAEAERAAVERIAGYEPVLAAARGLVSADMLDTMREAAIRDRVSPEVLRGRLTEYAWPEALRPTRLTFYLQHNTTRFVSPVRRRPHSARRRPNAVLSPADYRAPDRLRPLQGRRAARLHPLGD